MRSILFVLMGTKILCVQPIVDGFWGVGLSCIVFFFNMSCIQTCHAFLIVSVFLCRIVKKAFKTQLNSSQPPQTLACRKNVRFPVASNISGHNSQQTIRQRATIPGADSDVLAPLGNEDVFQCGEVIKQSDPREDHYFVRSLGQTRVQVMGRKPPNTRQPILRQHGSSLQFTSVQFKMVSMRSGRPIICPPPRLSGVSPMLPLKQFQCSNMGESSPLINPSACNVKGII